MFDYLVVISILSAILVKLAITSLSNTTTIPTQTALPSLIPHIEEFTKSDDFGRVRHQTSGRVFSVGDIHGDFQGLRRILRKAGLVSGSHQWIGGDAVLVQTGDLVDRGDESAQVYRFMGELRRQAPASGGKVVLILGNHEVMNLEADFRFVTEAETEGFGGSLQRRSEAFSKDGEFGRFVRTFPIGYVVERVFRAEEKKGASKGSALRSAPRNHSIFFLHAGLDPQFLRTGDGTSNSDGFDPLLELNREIAGILKFDTKIIAAASRTSRLLQEHGPLWNRYFALRPDGDAKMCGVLSRTLALVRADKCVVGHTVQHDGRPRLKCGERLLLGDVGFSPFYRSYGGRRVMVEHLPNGTTRSIELDEDDVDDEEVEVEEETMAIK